MPTYIYKAKDGPDKVVDGEIIAESESAALAKIEQMGYSPVRVNEESVERSARGRKLSLRRVSQRDVTAFTRQLASLLKSGVHILAALRSVGRQSTNARFRRALGEIEAEVRDGSSLSTALAQHGRIFPELYVNMVRSGEGGGILDVALERLADAMEKEDEVRKKVRSALAYPSLVLVVGLGTVFVMVTFFLPRIADLFRNFRELPAPTQVLIHVSDLCSRYWKTILLPVILVLLVAKRLLAGGKGRAVSDALKLRTPVIGRFLRDADVARFARTLSLLVRSGVPIDKGLSLGAGTLVNTRLRAEVDAVRERTVNHGMSMAHSLEDATWFPEFARNMIAVGEQSGRLDESLADVASFYEKEVEYRISLVTSLIEPVLILVVGAVVGFIVFAMLLPVFSVTRMIR